LGEEEEAAEEEESDFMMVVEVVEEVGGGPAGDIVFIMAGPSSSIEPDFLKLIDFFEESFK